MCISWRHAGDGNPINAANAQSAKQLRIYLTPSQAIKHFSFIHGRRDWRQQRILLSSSSHYPAASVHCMRSTHCSRYLAAGAFPPGWIRHPVSCRAANNSHIWHASCLCFSHRHAVPPCAGNVVIDGHANDEQDIRGWRPKKDAGPASASASAGPSAGPPAAVAS